VPEAIEKIITIYTDVREAGESLSDTYDRVGKEPFRDAVYA